MVPASVDAYEDEESEDSGDRISYLTLLSNKRILFANLCVFLSVIHFSFVDPILANYMNKQFGVHYSVSGYFFLLLGAGYTLFCFMVHITLRSVSNMRTAIVTSIFLGVFTILYDSSYLLGHSPSLVLLAAALFFAGGFNSHLVIPPMDEMISVGREIVDNEQK